MEVHVMVQRHWVQHTGDVAALEQGRQRGGEAQALVGA